jgi:hypothetical protein
MNNQVRIDFHVSWNLSREKILKDPLAKGLRNFGRYIPVRMYLEPTGEMLSERMFDIREPYKIHETHFVDLGLGRWSVRVEDLSGWLDLQIENTKLNGVDLFSNEFTLG